MILKWNLGDWKWYEWVKLNEQCHHATIDIYHIYSVGENLKLKFLPHTDNRPAGQTLIITQTHIFFLWIKNVENKRKTQAVEIHRANVDFTRHIVKFERRGKPRTTSCSRCSISATKRATICSVLQKTTSCWQRTVRQSVAVMITCRVTFLYKVLSTFLNSAI